VSTTTLLIVTSQHPSSNPSTPECIILKFIHIRTPTRPQSTRTASLAPSRAPCPGQMRGIQSKSRPPSLLSTVPTP
jgi:hypothetical protein